MSDAFCRRCRATFQRPLPTPYGAICPNCLARGNIVTLTDVPRSRTTGHGRGRGDNAGAAQTRTRRQAAFDRPR